MSRSLSMSDPFPAVASTGLAVEADDSSRSDGMVPTMLYTMAVRAVIFAVGVLSILTNTQHLDYGASGHAWVAFDANHYVWVLENGYTAGRPADARDFGDPNHKFYEIAYFPLFPFAARLLTPLFSSGNALLLIANVCAVVGFVFLYWWVRDLTGSRRIALVATLVMATYPGAVFFCGAQTEAPFFMMVAITLWLVNRKRLWWAAGLCGLATLLRPTGVALAAMVCFYALLHHYAHLPLAQRLARTSLIGLLSVSGGLAYEAFLWNRYGSFDAYVHAQEFWEWQEGESHKIQVAQGQAPRYSLPWFIDRAQRPQAWNRGIALLFVAVMIYGFYKPHGIPRVLFVLPLVIFLMTYLPNNGLRASSIIRYESAGLPVFALLAIWLSRIDMRRTLVALLVAQFAVQVYYAVLFSRGVWVG